MKTRLIISSIIFTILITVYNVFWGPTPDAPLWGKLLFSGLQGLAWYYFMRWATKKYANKEKRPEESRS